MSRNLGPKPTNQPTNKKGTAQTHKSFRYRGGWLTRNRTEWAS